MAKPNKKLPERSVDIQCGKCKTLLFKYKKGGKGALIKCFKERIVDDFTTTSCECPSCGSVFAREALVRGAPAYKIIGNKAVMR
ncbi:hypothetical protein LRP49_06485 [Enterovibrio sp. ZSDZ35]|uniref:Zn-ribbon motif protein n=1 Tax=Enterovibrio qingdaonensis TaxID=2899818 RepID=A0ABT5QIN4_9GAMM|nr:hypothetical protein [Enterovibrio sp. ZSDZ35]MDD1780846.1 hypothetical protein [Enterovibrio sp. ZSDZ35]